MQDESPRQKRTGLTILDVLFVPVGCLLQASPIYLMLGALVLAVVGGVVYYTANTDFLGLAGPGFDSLTVSASYEEIETGGQYWRITYERRGDSEFAGRVRHVSPIREGRLRILTHDILVTSGDYADPNIVRTSVSNHRFRWRSSASADPNGKINLLHTVPASEEIYQKLLAIRTADDVVITGREVLDINVYNQDGDHVGGWKDTGCNTLLVNSVTIVGE